MTDELDRPKSHRLAIGAAGAVLIVAFGAPLAGAARLDLPQAPVPPVVAPALPLPDPGVPDAPVDPVLPELPAPAPGTAVPEVTTLPVPVEELEGVTQPVTDVVEDVAGGAGDAVDEVVEDVTGEVDEVTGGVDEVTGDVDETVDEVTGGGPVGGAVDEVTGGGGAGGVVDEVTGGVTGPVEEVVEAVTGTVEDVKGELGNNAGAVVDRIVDAVDGPSGDGSTPPGSETGGTGGTHPGDAAGGRTSTPTDVAGSRTAREIAAAVSPDGFAGSTAVATLASATASVPPHDAPAPSLLERIARSAVDVAGQIAFPMLLALAVGAFVLVQNRVDRRDPKLALAALDAEEDLLGFE
ncbi:MAG: hypothetical protein M3323_10400 [Actinomycetota bacterium]|nr:hypothetical protein [Actinomycetota bacterium]